MSSSSKDVIYVDVDDEITGIIDKVRTSNEDIVALVLPKRSTVMQSIVNMKLLHKTSQEEDKKVVLITSEAGLLPLAGSVGVFVAKNLQSKPEIPTSPDSNTEEEVIDAEDMENVDKNKTLGELAGAAAVVGSVENNEDVIEVDNDDINPDESPEDPKKSDEKKDKKSKKDSKKLKVPNFDKFRTRLILIAVGGVALIVFLYLAFFIFPKAKIVIKTDSKSIAVNVNVIASTSVKEADIDAGIIPAESKKVSKTETAKAPATGTKDVGTKATGQITVENRQTPGSYTLPVGSKFTSSGGKVFTTNYAKNISPVTFDPLPPFTPHWGYTTIAVTSLENGTSYNIDATTYTNANLVGDYTNNGSKMEGGTSKTVTAIAQSDADNATKQITDKKEDYKKELKSQLQEAGLKPIEESFTCTNPSVNISPKVGDAGNEVTVTSSTDCTMVGVKEEDLHRIIENNLKSQTDIGNQSLLDDGLSQATITISGNEPGKTSMNIATIATVGPDINPELLKSEVAGKKKGEAENIIKGTTGVNDVKVGLSPFWVYKVPKKTSKINITFEKAQ